MSLSLRAPLVIVVAAAAACGPVPALQKGTEVFSDPGFSRAASNVFSCAHCHSPAQAGDPARKLPGYPLFDTAVRPTWWGGAYDDLFDAVSECYVEFMRGSALARDDVNGRALLVYLQSISPDSKAPALPLTIVANLDKPYYDKLAGGDKARGEATYKAACLWCHGDLNTGAGRLGPKVSIIPKESIDQHGTTDPLTGARPVTIEKVRHGKFFGTGGNMAQYSVEALSDEELKNILAYMGL